MTELKAINILKGDNELMLFDALTGETKTYESLNDMNKAVYDANLVAIKALEKQISLKGIVERLKELQEEYMYPDDDDYIVGQYDGVREALTVVLEEGGLND